MSLLACTLTLSLMMVLCGALPLVSRQISRHSKAVLLFGTGALLGLCLFGLVPEVVTAGGVSSFLLIAITGGIYSWIHLSHLTHHHHEHEHDASHPHDEGEAAAIGFLVGSMSLHCLADGIVLAVSASFSATMARTVFFALVAHKGYEAFNVSALLKEKARSLGQFSLLITGYALSFPLGVGLAWAVTRHVPQSAIPQWITGLPVLIMSVAVGGLLGCLLHDFLIPSLHRIRHRRAEVLWLILGLVLSTLMRGGV